MSSTLSIDKLIGIVWGSESSSYEIELRNQLMQNDVTLWVTSSIFYGNSSFESLTRLLEILK